MPKHTTEEVDVLYLLEKFRQLENRMDSVEKSQHFISETYDVTNSKINVLESDLLKAKNDTDTAIHLAKEAQTMISTNKINYASAVKQQNRNTLAGRRNSFNNYNDKRRGSSYSDTRPRASSSSNPGPRTGSSLANAGSLGQAARPTTRLGAPPRSRYLVIGRVLKDKKAEDIKNYINEMDSTIEIRSLEPISHVDARAQKFKLEVSVSDFFKVKDRNFWESGISCYPFRGEWNRDTTDTTED